MKDYFKIKSWLITFFIVVLGVSFSTLIAFFEFEPEVPAASAGSTANLMGFAWSSNYGWISFNSLNCDANNDGDWDGNGVNGCPYSSDDFFEYGVNVDTTTGEFTGSAWSQNLGNIIFSDFQISLRKDPTDDWYTGPATMDMDTGEVTGWALMDHTVGNDYWLKMSGVAKDGSEYGVNLDKCTGELRGYAWGGQEEISGDINGIGWVSFSSDYCDDGGGLSNGGLYCPDAGDPIIEYGVSFWKDFSNEKPTVTVIGHDFLDKCADPFILGANLNWQFNDPADEQAEFCITITKDSFGGTPVYGETCFSGLDGVGSSFTFTSTEGAQFGETYYWQVKVKDNCGMWSDYSDWQTLPFYDHQYPTVEFSYTPEQPKIGTEVVVTDTNSKVYGSNPAGDLCDSVNCDRQWVVTLPNILKDDGTSTSTIAVYDVTAADTDITLTITDNTGYSCSHTETIPFQEQTPYWFERRPK